SRASLAARSNATNVAQFNQAAGDFANWGQSTAPGPGAVVMANRAGQQAEVMAQAWGPAVNEARVNPNHSWFHLEPCLGCVRDGEQRAPVVDKEAFLAAPPIKAELDSHLLLVNGQMAPDGVAVLGTADNFLQKGHHHEQSVKQARNAAKPAATANPEMRVVKHESDPVSTVLTYYCTAKTEETRPFIVGVPELHRDQSELGLASIKLFGGKEGSARAGSMAAVVGESFAPFPRPDEVLRDAGSSMDRVKE
ncbi:unnamed protein product, partial [Prorocentrum cordatum]